MSSSHQSEAGSEAKRVLMDLNQSMEFDLAADDPSAQVENVLPVNSSMLPYHQATEEHHRPDLELFWNQQLSEISNATDDKRRDSLMISKACELFILELTLHARMAANH
ncbi:hypothetical protein Peur_052972 [Populus x canadensis]